MNIPSSRPCLIFTAVKLTNYNGEVTVNIPFVIGVAFIMFSIYMLKHALFDYKKALASKHWPAVSGQLTTVTLFGLRNINGKMLDANRLAVEYCYEIAGKSYIGNALAFYTLVYPQTYEFAKMHASGSEIRVYYNPDRPTDSVLLTGVNKDKPYSDIIIGAITLVAGIALAISGWAGLIG